MTPPDDDDRFWEELFAEYHETKRSWLFGFALTLAGWAAVGAVLFLKY